MNLKIRNEPQASATAATTQLLPPLPYAVGALEPVIDARTMVLHHDKHHAAYVQKLSAALEPFAELRTRSPTWLLENLRALPERIRTEVQHNAGGHLNHSLYWQSMSPASTDPVGPLADALAQAFGGLQQFKTRFEEAGAKLFGSGWVWLVAARAAGAARPTLEIVTTTGHDNPIQDGKHALLVNDVWEHAYYLRYENRRPEFLKAWWAIVNWREAASRFEQFESGQD